MTSGDCIFCKIVKGEIKSQFIYEDKRVIVFDDINPVANVHVLIVPKNHIESALALGSNDAEDLVAMFKAAKILVKEKNLESFRLAFNGGKYQHVGHLHMHLVAGGNVKWEKL